MLNTQSLLIHYPLFRSSVFVLVFVVFVFVFVILTF